MTNLFIQERCAIAVMDGRANEDSDAAAAAAVELLLWRAREHTWQLQLCTLDSVTAARSSVHGHQLAPSFATTSTLSLRSSSTYFSFLFSFLTALYLPSIRSSVLRHVRFLRIPDDDETRFLRISRRGRRRGRVSQSQSSFFSGEGGGGPYLPRRQGFCV